MILNFRITNQAFQKLNPEKNFLKYLTSPTLILFMTLLHHLLTNLIPLGALAKHKPPIKLLEQIMIYDRYREKLIVFSFPQLPLRKTYQFHDF